MHFPLYFRVFVDWTDGHPVILAAVLVQIFSLDRHFSQRLASGTLALFVTDIEGEDTEATGNLEVELLSKEGTASE